MNVIDVFVRFLLYWLYILWYFIGLDVGIELFVLLFMVELINLFFIINLGLILKKIGFYKIMLVSLFGLIDFIYLEILCVIVGLIVYLVI